MLSKEYYDCKRIKNRHDKGDHSDHAIFSFIVKEDVRFFSCQLLISKNMSIAQRMRDFFVALVEKYPDFTSQPIVRDFEFALSKASEER